MEKVLNDYLEKIEKYLKPLPVSERVDIVKEIKSEMLELQRQEAERSEEFRQRTEEHFEIVEDAQERIAQAVEMLVDRFVETDELEQSSCNLCLLQPCRLFRFICNSRARHLRACIHSMCSGHPHHGGGKAGGHIASSGPALCRLYRHCRH